MKYPPNEYLIPGVQFNAANFPDIYHPIWIASLILLIGTVILYNVRVRQLHRHEPLRAMQEWLLWTGLVTFGLTGYSGGKLKAMQQHGLHVALDDMGMVESTHLCLFHWVLNDVFARINHEGRYAN